MVLVAYAGRAPRTYCVVPTQVRQSSDPIHQPYAPYIVPAMKACLSRHLSYHELTMEELAQRIREMRGMGLYGFSIEEWKLRQQCLKVFASTCSWSFQVVSTELMKMNKTL